MLQTIYYNSQFNDGFEVSATTFASQLCHLGKLDVLCLQVHHDEDNVEDILKALTPPDTPRPPKFDLKIVHDNEEPDTSFLRGVLVPYIREHPEVTDFGFCCWEDDPDYLEAMLQYDLHQLSRDNAWMGHVDRSSTASVSAILQGRRTPAVLYHTLQQRAAELIEHW